MRSPTRAVTAMRGAVGLEQRAQRTASPHGVRYSVYVVDIFGLCASCANRQDASTGAAQ